MTLEEKPPRHRVIQDPGGPSKTKQSFADEADINTVLNKWRRSGITTDVNLGTPVYADFSSGLDYHAAVNAVMRTQQLFDTLPARVRDRVDNDPGKFIEFVEDPNNAQELVDLGLKNPVSPDPVAPEVKTPEGITNGGKPPEGEESDPA